MRGLLLVEQPLPAKQERATFTSPRLPAGFDGCTIVQLSDLHGAEFGEDNEELIRRVREAEPDYIFLTGDLLDRYRQTPRSYAVSLGKSLAGIAPTYFVTGNHEWALPDVPGLKRKLEEAGVQVLTNEYAVLARDGDNAVLAGIDDPNGYADQKTPEEVAEEKSVDKLYERLNNQMNRLNQALSQSARADTPLAKTVANVSNNINFMNQLNQMFTYVQIPLKMQGQNANGELFVYTNKKSLAKKDGSVSALLHLDMEHLGSVDVHVSMTSQKVATKFLSAG